MTPHQIQLVRTSFAAIAPRAPAFAATFYRTLFAADPAIASLFSGDMVQQGARLTQMIGAAVGLLQQPTQLVPVLQRLGERHAGYGVVQAHYDTVGAVLLQTLAEALGPAFDADTREAWTVLYGVVSETMQAAAAVAA